MSDFYLLSSILFHKKKKKKKKKKYIDSRLLVKKVYRDLEQRWSFFSSSQLQASL